MVALALPASTCCGLWSASAPLPVAVAPAVAMAPGGAACVFPATLPADAHSEHLRESAGRFRCLPEKLPAGPSRPQQAHRMVESNAEREVGFTPRSVVLSTCCQFGQMRLKDTACVSG